jgi:hypothetical protein
MKTIYIVTFCGNMEAFFSTKSKAIEYAKETFTGEGTWEDGEGQRGCEVGIEKWVEGEQGPEGETIIELTWSVDNVKDG